MKHNPHQIYSVDQNGTVWSGYDCPEQEFNAASDLEPWQQKGDVEFATAAEKLALADEMIARWTAYKAKVLAAKNAP